MNRIPIKCLDCLLRHGDTCREFGKPFADIAHTDVKQCKGYEWFPPYKNYRNIGENTPMKAFFSACSILLSCITYIFIGAALMTLLYDHGMKEAAVLAIVVCVVHAIKEVFK